MRARVTVALCFAVLVALLAYPRTAVAALPCGLLTPVDRLFNCESGSSATADAGDDDVAPVTREPRWRGITQARVDPRRLLATFAPGTPLADASRVAGEAGGTLERRIAQIGVDVIIAEPERLDQVRENLRRSALVDTVASEQIVAATAVQPDDAFWAQQTGLQLTRFPDVWGATRGSSDVVVAVIDTGVSSIHADLAGAVLPGNDLVNGDADPSDDHGHGTAVAGVVAARGNNGQGIAGACWLCLILPVKVLTHDGTGPTSAVAAGIVWAADHGADVINLSLGSPETTVALADAVAYAIRQGALVVAAAGNAGLASPFFPAAEPGTLAVAATDDGDRLYGWSNFGPWVHLAAPGCLQTTLVGGEYGVECGTSFAAPLVSGLAALALAAQPALSADGVASVLRRGAVAIGSSVQDGRVDAARSFSLLPKAPVRRTVVLRSTLATSRTVRIFTLRTAAGDLVATLNAPGRSQRTLALTDAEGRVLARVRGRSPLRLSSRVATGLHRLRTSGAKGRFTISVSCLVSENEAGRMR